MNKWQNPLLSLGERCVAFSENEMLNGVKEDHLNSFTSPRIREYFSICTRLINNKEIPIHLSSGNWCSSGGCFAMHSSLLPGETPPHGYRVGVLEVISDLQKNGLWIDISTARYNKYNLKVGDVVVFDRSQPNRPETSWWRHFARIYSVNDAGFQCISGNSGGCWKISNHVLSQSNLVGFGAYPDLNSQTIQLPQEGFDWTQINLNDLAPLQDTGSDLDKDPLGIDNFFDAYNKVFK